MTRIVFIEHNGKRHEVDAIDGDSLMRAAIDHNVTGIVGDCGGCLSCATCHAYVDPTAPDQIPEMQQDERDVLEGVVHPQDNSRLSCQIIVGPQLEGLEIRLPTSQF